MKFDTPIYINPTKMVCLSGIVDDDGIGQAHTYLYLRNLVAFQITIRYITQVLIDEITTNRPSKEGI